MSWRGVLRFLCVIAVGCRDNGRVAVPTSPLVGEALQHNGRRGNEIKSHREFLPNLDKLMRSDRERLIAAGYPPYELDPRYRDAVIKGRQEHMIYITESTKGCYRDIVGLSDDSETNYCTGILVDRFHVLTAAHCATKTKVFVGDIARTSASLPIKVFSSTRAVSGDLALLELEDPIDGIPSRPFGILPQGCDWVLGIGFGATDDLSIRAGEKQMAWLNVVSPSCQDRLVAGDFQADSDYYDCIAGTDLVTGGPSSFCGGDSGGPALAMINGTFHVVAVAGKSLCKKQTVFARSNHPGMSSLGTFMLATSNGNDICVPMDGNCVPKPPKVE